MNKSDDGPFPRYKFSSRTQRWYPVSLKGAVSKGDISECTKAAPLFVSSFDYFLRRSYAMQKCDNVDGEALRKQRDETYMEIDRFQARHALAGAQSFTVTEKDSSDEDRGNSSEIDGEDREGTVVVQSRVEFANPLMGYVSGFPLYKIYETLCKLKKKELEGEETNLASVHLSFEEFRVLVSTIGDKNLLSPSYLQKMFSSLPNYANSTLTVQAFDFFSYIVENTYHPSLSRNAAMLFYAFGQDSDLIPLVALHSRVVLAWAETNTFGNLRREWAKLAQALETVEKKIFEDKLIVRHSLYLTSRELRALLCSDLLLWNVCNSIDMEGGGKTEKSEER